jgi:hypothetical protein
MSYVQCVLLCLADLMKMRSGFGRVHLHKDSYDLSVLDKAVVNTVLPSFAETVGICPHCIPTAQFCAAQMSGERRQPVHTPISPSRTYTGIYSSVHTYCIYWGGGGCWLRHNKQITSILLD